MSLASLLSGLVQALGTRWGLFRHYWVLFKLLITVLSTIILLMYMETLSYLSGVAAETTLSSGDLSGLREPSPALHAGAGLLLLLVAATLSVYKPRGVTPYGRRRKQQEERGIKESG